MLLSVPGTVLNRVLLERMREAIDPMLRDQQAGFRRNRSAKAKAQEEYTAADTEVKRSIRKDKRDYIDNLASQAEEAARQGNLKDLYQVTKKLAGKFQQTDKPVKDKNRHPLTTTEEQLKRWAEHFRELLNRPIPETPPHIPPAETKLPINCDKPCKAEIRKAIMTLRNAKAAGPGEIPAEAIKADTETAVNMLHSLFSKIWEKEESLEWNSPFYINFIDYEKAFDSVDREVLWKLLRHYGVTRKIISLIQCTYQDMRCRIAHAGQLSESFKVKAGVRQGYLLSPFLFLLAIDWIMKTTTKGRKNGIQWTLWTQLDVLDFADDLALLSHSHSQMQDKTTCLEAISRNRAQDQQEENRADEDQHHCQHTSHSRWRAHQGEKIRNEELWERAGQEPEAKQILRRKWGWIGHTLREPAASTTRQALGLNVI
nr:hypothetical protein BaRGS_017211 [Batillaria attramentaria]